MENRRFKRYILLLITIVLLPLSFPVPEQRPAFAMSIDQEREMGDEFLVSVKNGLHLVENDYAVQFINDLGNYLTSNLDTKPFPFHFYIVKENQLNAFAGPGGHIFFYTGLIDKMDKIDELAAVMCHEIGHVTSRHISERLEKDKLLNIATMVGLLAGSLASGDTSEAIMTGTMAAVAQIELGYSRDDERQADQVGFKYAYLSGFDTSAMVSALGKIQQISYGTNEVPQYLLTHPLGPERMSNIESLIASNPAPPKRDETEYFRERYPLVRTILKAYCMEARDAERYFRSELGKEPESHLAHFGLAIALKEESEYPEAIDHFQKAIEGLPDTLPALRLLSETYQLNGQDKEAIELLEEVLESNDKDQSTLFLLATSYQNCEEYSKASEIYEKLTFLEPVNDEVYYNLGIIYGREDRLDLAHYNFGIYYKKLNRLEEARFHFQKAKELATDNPELLERIKKAMEETSDMRPGGRDGNAPEPKPQTGISVK